LQEVEAICSRVLIINEGKIAAQGTPEEIAGTMKGGDTWELLLKGADAETVLGKLASLGEGLSSVFYKPSESGALSLSFFIPADISAGGNSAGDIPAGERIFDWAVAGGLKILGMNRKKLSLEDIFVSLTSEENK
jgi:ABC-2 type transport system ATP-binding protein